MYKYDETHAIYASMDIDQIRYFQAIVRAGGFSSAARALRVQQPTLSRAVRALEEDLGVRLLERTTRVVRTTPEGARFLDECRKLLDIVEGIPSQVRQTESEFRGSLRFAVSEALCKSVLPETLKALLSRHPAIIPSVAVGMDPRVFQDISRGAVEFGVFFGIPERSLGLSSTLIAEIPFYFVVAKKHRKDPRVLSSYISAREYEEGRIRNTEEWKALHCLSSNAQIRISSDSYALHREFVLGGLGISFLPEFMIRQEIASNLLTVLNSKALFVELFLTTRKAERLSPKALAFLSLLKSQIGESRTRARK